MTEAPGAGSTPPVWRRLLVVMTLGLGLSIVGSLGLAVATPDGLSRTIAVVLLFVSTALVAPLIALWRLPATERRERDANRPRGI